MIKLKMWIILDSIYNFSFRCQHVSTLICDNCLLYQHMLMKKMWIILGSIYNSSSSCQHISTKWSPLTLSLCWLQYYRKGCINNFPVQRLATQEYLTDGSKINQHLFYTDKLSSSSMFEANQWDRDIYILLTSDRYRVREKVLLNRI